MLDAAFQPHGRRYAIATIGLLINDVNFDIPFSQMYQRHFSGWLLILSFIHPSI
jgi:hypothetical protein